MTPPAAKKVALEIGQRELANGLTLLAVRNPGIPTAAISVSLDADARDEPAAAAGLANLVAECLDEGSQKRSAVEFAEQLDRIGATLDCGVSGATVHCPAEVQARAVSLLHEAVFLPAFPAREVRRVQHEVLTEIHADDDDPRYVAGARFRRAVYGRRHPYGRAARGTAKTVEALRGAQLRAFHKRFYRGAGGYVAAAGPAGPQETLDLLEKVFRRVPGGKDVERPVPRAPVLPDAVHDSHHSMNREQVHVFVGHLGIRRADPDYHALSVMDHILGTGPGFTSRISRRLRDEMGLCYSVDASITRGARDEPGTFMAYIGTSPEHRQKAIDGFLEEMARIREKLPTQKELEDVQQYLTGSFVWQLERNAALARYLVRALKFDLGLDYVDRYPELIRSVTRQEVRRVAREHLHPEGVVIVSAGAG